MMKCGTMYSPGDVLLCQVQFTDSFELKTRPVVVLFQEYGNIIAAGITSNTKMTGIPLSIKEGAVKDSVIKTNYIFTTSEVLVKKKLFSLSKEKKNELYQELNRKLSSLKN